MLFYQNKGQGENLILLHGWGFHSGIFNELSDELAKDFCVTLVDFPGFGQSPIADGDYDLQMLSNAILKIAPANAIYIGWSLGGLVATNIAQYHPNRVSKLINICSSPKFVADNDWPGIAMKDLEIFSQGLITNYQTTLKNFILLQWHNSNLEYKKIQQLKTNLFQYGTPHIKALIGGLEILDSTDLRKKLSAINCPIQYILGQLDRIVPATVNNYINKLDPKINLKIIPKSSHAPFISNLTETTSHIKDFIYAQ